MTLLAVITFVRTYWRLAALGVLALLLAVQTVRLGHAKSEIERREIDIRELRFELKSISDKKNEQAKATERNIDQAERGNREADERARKIEAAPLPGNCVTPPEILGADL